MNKIDEMSGLSGYNQRQNIEVVLNSEFGTTVGSVDGRKRYNLDTEIVANQNEILLISLKKAFIPFSFYCLDASQKNNRLSVRETKTDATTTSYSITIPSGNYQITTLIEDIADLMEAQSGSAGFDFKYEFTYSADTNKVSIRLKSGTNASSADLLFLTGTNASNSCRRVLGFSENDFNIPVSTTITSDNVVDCADGLDGIRIKTDLPISNVLTNGGQIGDEMLIIPIDVAPNGIIYFAESGNTFKHLLTARQLKSIEVNMTDRNGNTINMNSIPYTFIMEVYFEFDVQRALVERANLINPQPTQQGVDLQRLEESNKKLLDDQMEKIKKLFEKK